MDGLSIWTWIGGSEWTSHVHVEIFVDAPFFFFFLFNIHVNAWYQ